MRLQQHDTHCKHLSWYEVSTTFIMYRSQIGCKHEPQLTVDAELVEVVADDLWRCSGVVVTFIVVIRFPDCCWMIGVGLICVKMPDPSTMPATELLAGRLPLQLSLTFVVICAGWAAFISMGTTTGGDCVNIRKSCMLWLDRARRTIECSLYSIFAFRVVKQASKRVREKI